MKTHIQFSGSLQSDDAQTILDMLAAGPDSAIQRDPRALSRGQRRSEEGVGGLVSPREPCS